jgi:ribose transport system ATP-binding protein
MYANEEILSCNGLYKSFGSTVAIKEVDFSLNKGEIMGLVGENGAGKSTLIKLLAGEHLPERGKIFYRGKQVSWKNPNQALKNGIGIVHQTPLLIRELNVADNIFLGQEFTVNGLLSEKIAFSKTQELLEEYKIFPNLDLTKKIMDMSAGEREVVEILKVLSYRPDILIMDEPTASLPSKEIEELVKLLKALNQNGNLSIIFISHKLEEVFDVCSEITVLRNGEIAGQVDKEHFNKDIIIKMMINDDINKFYPGKSKNSGEQLLQISHLSYNLNNRELLKDINFTVNKGEIVGFYGLMGAGMTELMECIFGLRDYSKGKIIFKNQELSKTPVHQRIEKGIYYISSDRHKYSIFNSFTILENLSISHLSHIFKHGFLDNRREKTLVEKAINNIDFNVKYASLDQKMSELSGGNQQKVVILRWLLKECEVLILDDPTVGIDIATKHDIYLLLRQLNSKGIGVILISSEIAEILGMADRIYTMSDGQISAELKDNDISQENILKNIV